jgi:methyl-accepting chemotaxis protein
MITKQEGIFSNLKGASGHLDELSLSLSSEISKFKVN